MVPGEIGTALQERVRPWNVASISAVLTIWAVAQTTPVGCEAGLATGAELLPAPIWLCLFILRKPVSRVGKLWLEEKLIPGISIRVTPPGEYWPVTFDSASGWLAIEKEILVSYSAIESIEGCIVILRAGEIVGLRLHPDSS